MPTTRREAAAAAAAGTAPPPWPGAPPASGVRTGALPTRAGSGAAGKPAAASAQPGAAGSASAASAAAAAAEVPALRLPLAAPDHRARRRIDFRWGVGDELCVFVTSPPPDAAAAGATAAAVAPAPAPTAPPAAVVTALWDAWPEECVALRKLGRDVFAELQSVAPAAAAAGAAGLAASEEEEARRRGALARASSRLRRAYAEVMGGPATSAWGALEAVHLGPPGESPRVAVTRWAYECHPVSTQGITDALVRTELLLLRGQPREAARLLASIPPFAVSGREDAAFVEALNAAVGLMEAMPVPGEPAPAPARRGSGSAVAYAHASAPAEPTAAAWMLWRDRVAETRARHPTELRGRADRASLASLCAVMEGDFAAAAAAVMRHAERGARWPHLLAAMVLFHAPTLLQHQLGALAESCRAQWPDPEIPPSVLAACRGDVVLTLQLLRGELGDAWVEAHVAEIFARGGAFDCPSLAAGPAGAAGAGGAGGAGEAKRARRNPLLDRAGAAAGPGIAPLELDVRECALVRYACQVGLGGKVPSPRSAASSADAWHCAVDYLAPLTRRTTANGQQLSALWTELLASRADFASDEDAKRVHAALLERRLAQAAESVAMKRASAWFHRGAMRAAIDWAAHVDVDHVNRMVLAVLTDEQSTIQRALDVVGTSDDWTWGAELEQALPGSTNLLAQLARVNRHLAAARGELARGAPEWVVARDLALREVCAVLEPLDSPLPRHLQAPLMREVLLFESASERVRRNPPRLTVSQALALLRVVDQLAVRAQAAYLSGGGDAAFRADDGLDDLRLVLVAAFTRATEAARWKAPRASGGGRGAGAEDEVLGAGAGYGLG